MINLKHIKKKYEERIIFEDLNLTIDDGDFVYIVGESGAGKSTLLNLIGLMDDDFEGEYYIESELVSKNNKNNYRKKYFGFIFQMYCLIENITVFENLKIPLIYDENIDFSKIDDILDELGITSLKDKKVKKLSGGEKQRVAIARALINNQKYIICDEPTGNLDSKNTNLIIDILREQNRLGRTIIIVTHNKGIIKKDDIVYEIENKTLQRRQ